MTADVVTPFDRGLEPSRRPFRGEQRAQRRRAWFIERIGRAKTPEAKVDAAIDLFRATACDRKIDPVAAAAVSDQVVQYLLSASDQIAKTLRRTR